MYSINYIYIYVHIYIYIISIQPLGRFRQEPEPSQATGMALACCILGKFLGLVCHCFPPPLDVPTLAARCLHVPINASAPSSGRLNCGREWSGNFAEMTPLLRHLGIFYTPQICDMGQTAYIYIYVIARKVLRTAPADKGAQTRQLRPRNWTAFSTFVITPQSTVTSPRSAKALHTHYCLNFPHHFRFYLRSPVPFISLFSNTFTLCCPLQGNNPRLTHTKAKPITANITKSLPFSHTPTAESLPFNSKLFRR
jgi:hypothetical protein